MISRSTMARHSTARRQRARALRVGTATVVAFAAIAVNLLPPRRSAGAMPMLTGWDLSEICDDEHKRRVGAWIDDFTYTRLPGDPFGTLRYTVATTFGDDDPFGFSDRVQVDVLGINTIDPVLDPDNGPTPQPGPGLGSVVTSGGGTVGGF